MFDHHFDFIEVYSWGYYDFKACIMGQSWLNMPEDRRLFQRVLTLCFSELAFVSFSLARSRLWVWCGKRIFFSLHCYIYIYAVCVYAVYALAGLLSLSYICIYIYIYIYT
jgi:hypothetical protein